MVPDRVYVMDRGYAKFALFQRIIDAGSSFVCRTRDNNVFGVTEERELSDEALAAGIVRDAVVHFPNGKDVLKGPLRIVESECTPHRKASGKRGRGGPEQGDTILACPLIALWTGGKPTLRTYERVCFDFIGLAEENEFLAHIAKLQRQS